MRYTFYFALIVFGAVIFAACNAIDHSAKTKPAQLPGSDTVYADGARRVTIDEMDAMVKNGQAIIVDVRNQASYDMGHIPGAKLIPEGEILNHLNDLPRDKMSGTYCSLQAEYTPTRAVATLKTKGIDNAAALLGGFNLWQQEKRPIEKKQ